MLVWVYLCVGGCVCVFNGNPFSPELGFNFIVFSLVFFLFCFCFICFYSFFFFFFFGGGCFFVFLGFFACLFSFIIFVLCSFKFEREHKLNINLELFLRNQWNRSNLPGLSQDWSLAIFVSVSNEDRTLGQYLMRPPHWQPLWLPFSVFFFLQFS